MAVGGHAGSDRAVGGKHRRGRETGIVESCSAIAATLFASAAMSF